MPKENKATARRVIEEFLNTGNLDVADELFAADYLDHNPSNPELRGIENIKKSVSDWHAVFSDTHNTVEDVIAEGDKVAVRWITRGIHREEFMDVPTFRDGFELGSDWSGNKKRLRQAIICEATSGLTVTNGSGIIADDAGAVVHNEERERPRWGVAKWQGTGFWSRDRRFESCRPSLRYPCGELPWRRSRSGVVATYVPT